MYIHKLYNCYHYLIPQYFHHTLPPICKKSFENIKVGGIGNDLFGFNIFMQVQCGQDCGINRRIDV